MDNLDQKILNLKQQIQDYQSQLKPQFLIEDDCEYQEQLELRWHIQELEEELEKALLDNQAEEWIEGWG